MARERSTTTAADPLLIGAEIPNAAPTVAKTPPRDQRRALRTFALRVLIFCAPLIFLVVGIEFLLWRAGETWPLERVIRFQETHPRAFFARLVIDHGLFHYKYLQVLRRRAHILVLGSSRVMQIRAEMFGRQGESFYNAGGLIHSVEDLQLFADRLPPEATPKIVILGVDFWWLNADEKRTENDAFAVGGEEDGTYRWQGHAMALSGYARHPDALLALVRHSFGASRDENAIGLQALLYRQGFRADGSKRFAMKLPRTPEAWARRLPAPKIVNKDILGGGFPFAFTDGVSIGLTDQLRAALLKLQARGIYVIGYCPPVIEAWSRVASVAPRQKDYWKQFHEKIPALFRSLNLPFIDIETPSSLGLDDRYMRDAYHANDPFNLQMLRRFCEEPKIRAVFPDVPNVAQAALNSPRTNPMYLDLPGDEKQTTEASARRQKLRRH